MEKKSKQEREECQAQSNQYILDTITWKIEGLKKAIESKDIIKLIEYSQDIAQLGRPLILAKYRYEREIYNYTRIFNVL